MYMSPSEFVALLEDAIQRHAGRNPKTLALTLVGRSGAAFRELGVRPEVLAHHEDGTKVYGFDLRQVEKMLGRLT